MKTATSITKALWSATASAKSYPQLPGDLTVDVAVVGGGITGLTTAYLLAKAGKKVAVLESYLVGYGTTGSSTGNLYAPVDERLHTISSKHNTETMRAVAASRSAAVNFIEQRVQEHRIDCDFKRVPWLLFATAGKDLTQQVEKERQAAEEAGLFVSDQAPAGFPYEVTAITNIANQAQFNPLRYVQGLANAINTDNCQIFEHTKVELVEDGTPCVVHTNRGKVRATKVIMATHSPKGVYAVHTAMEPYREYALAVRLEGDLPADGIYWHMQQMSHYSVRPYRHGSDAYLLVLGEAHKVGHKEQNEDNLQQVENYLRAHFPVAEVVYAWAAQNYKPADALPFIGTSPMEEHIYIATGFSADGLTYGTLSGMILSDEILGKPNPWAKIYDPKRFTPLASAPKFMKENMDVAVNLVKDYLFYGEADGLDEVKPGEGKTLEVDGEKVAAYRDQLGNLHAVSPVCTHMGCIVHWNNAEKSWDCPCHGSRFSVDGEVLEGPAYQSLAKRSLKPKGAE